MAFSLDLEKSLNKQAPLDLQGDTSPPVRVLGGCPGIREAAEASVPFWEEMDEVPLGQLLWLGTATVPLPGLCWGNVCLRATKTVCSQTPHSF